MILPSNRASVEQTQQVAPSCYHRPDPTGASFWVVCPALLANATPILLLNYLLALAVFSASAALAASASGPLRALCFSTRTTV